MIKIIIVIFVILTIVGIIMEHWEQIVKLLLIIGMGYLSLRLFGLTGIILILCFIGIACVIIKGFKLLIKRLQINKCKSAIKLYLSNSKIETYNSIVKNTKLVNNTKVEHAFMELQNEGILVSEVENGNEYFMSHKLRNSIKLNNYNALIKAIDSLGMADYLQLISVSGTQNNRFVKTDINNLCKEKKMIKEIIPTKDKEKEICYKSIHYLDNGYNFKNYVVNEINLD